MSRFAWPIVVVMSSVAALVVFVMGIGQPIAPIVALWFLGVCPGISYVRLLGLTDPLMEMVLAVALSMSIGAVLSVVLLFAGVWSTGLALVLTVWVAVIGAGLEALREFRSAGDSSPIVQSSMSSLAAHGVNPGDR